MNLYQIFVEVCWSSPTDACVCFIGRTVTVVCNLYCVVSDAVMSVAPVVYLTEIHLSALLRCINRFI